jgi:AcrR family transcriptional regulator
VSSEARRLRAVDGRTPGKRGMRTRESLLRSTAELLETTSYRDLAVVDVTKRAGTSPATFYQYFADIEAALLELARELVEEGPAIVELIRSADWKAKGTDTARELVDAFVELWERHHPILRVVALATAEGDLRFRNVRTHLLSDITEALRDAIVRHRNGVPNPRAEAATLVSLLAHVAEHRYGYEFWGIKIDDVSRSTARHVAWGITGR